MHYPYLKSQATELRLIDNCEQVAYYQGVICIGNHTHLSAIRE